MKRRDAMKTAIGSVLGFLAALFVAKAAEEPMVTVMETWYLANPAPDHIYGIEYWIENRERPVTELSHAETSRLVRAIQRRREEVARDFHDRVCPVWEAKLFGDKP